MSERKPNLILRSDMPLEEFIEKIIVEMRSLEVDFSYTGFGTWSHSKLKAFSSCYLYFLLNNLLKIKYELTESEMDMQESLRMKFTGIIAHGILEDLVNGIDFDTSLAKHKDKYQSDLSEEAWLDIESLRDRTQMFMDRFNFFSEIHGKESHHTEQKLAIDYVGNPVPFDSKKVFFRGVLDLSILLKNGDAILFDHKNGGSAEHGLRNYESQLKSQALLLSCNRPDIKSVVPFIHFIQEGGIAGGNNVYKRGTIQEEFLKSIVSRIDGSIEILKEKRKFKQSSGNLCQYCEFKAMCKTGKRGSGGLLKPIIDESVRFFK